MTTKLVAAGLAAALAFGVSAASAQSVDKASKTFITNAIEGNYAEIDAGKLAQDKANRDDIKQYGAMLVKDHTAANEKAIAAARQIGVDPPTGASVMQKAEYLKLKVLSGNAFDRSFRSGMIKDHQDAIKMYSREALRADAAGSYAKEALPTLRHHLQDAQALGSGATVGGAPAK